MSRFPYVQPYFACYICYFKDEEEEIFKRDFTGATLEDHFDKTVLPKAMQVKNFGRSGRTKYTHLVDQDTTVVSTRTQNIKDRLQIALLVLIEVDRIN